MALGACFGAVEAGAAAGAEDAEGYACAEVGEDGYSEQKRFEGGGLIEGSRE